MVGEGGSVATQSGSFSCASGETCIVDVVDVFFDETFMGEPANGYEFSHWAKRPGGFCGGSSTPCRLFTTLFGGNEFFVGVLASDLVFSLTSIF